MVSREIQVLLAGGAADEAQDFADALSTAQPRTRVRHVPAGDDVIACLRGRGSFQKPFPANLIILDADDRSNDSMALLSKLKSDATLLHIPVVMLATHQTDDELRDAYDQGVSCCVRKSGDPGQWMRALHATNTFWLSVAKLPVE